MEVSLLGPVEVRAAGRPVDLHQPRQRAVVAALAVDLGRPVQIDTLIDRVWGAQPPRQVRQALYTYISQLRRSASPDRLVRRSGGYLLDLDPDQVDVHRFRRLVTAARAESCPPPERVVLLRGAIDLWRGTPLADVSGDWAARVRGGWQQEHLDTVIAWADAELCAGEPHRTLGPLAALVEEHPLDEPLAARLITALHAGGRGAEALHQYARTRSRLAEELGTDPGPELQRLHRALLGDPGPDPVTERVPAQLPHDVQGFVGRRLHLARLDALLDDQSTAMPIAVVSGTAGVGKTALAVHWSHLVRSHFPDGQLYVDLRGFDPACSVMTTTEAVRRFLEALHVPPLKIPAELDGRAALYRSLLADRRMLIVLDNALDPAQVRPLLPGAAGCLVLITSRNRLTSLIAAEAAHPLPLDLMDQTEARDLLHRRLGSGRPADPATVGRIIDRCARLPLALAVVAARAATHPQLPLWTLADELDRATLDPFTGEDAVSDVRTVFSWSYRALRPAAAAVFRLLGLHPGPEVTAGAVASLAGEPVERAGPLLAELAGAHLLTEIHPGRYACHDLLRAYAGELTRALDTDADRRAALHRLLDHYLHSAHAAAHRVDPNRSAIALAPPQPGTRPDHISDHRAALRWFTAEHPVLLAAIAHAARTGFDAHVWQLAWTLSNVCDLRGRWHDTVDTQVMALSAARRLGDPVAEAHALRSLGVAYAELGRYEEADQQLRRALRLFHEAGHVAGEGRTGLNLTFLLERQGRCAEALDRAEQCHRLLRDSGLRGEPIAALNWIGWLHAVLGHYDEAVLWCRRALAALELVDDRQCEAATWDSLGYAYCQLGRFAESVDALRRAIRMFRDIGDRFEEANSLTRLGGTHRAAGDVRAAGEAWREALSVLTELGHRDAADIRAKLAGLDGAATPR
jgi:DNA-binding SARP family transcriptional activator/tetratricopeptide (TPR) repeat protein